MAQNSSVRKSRPNILVAGTTRTSKITTSSALAEATQFCHTSSEIWSRRRTSMTVGTTSLTVTLSMKTSYSYKTLFLFFLFLFWEKCKWNIIKKHQLKQNKFKANLNGKHLPHPRVKILSIHQCLQIKLHFYLNYELTYFPLTEHAGTYSFLTSLQVS